MSEENADDNETKAVVNKVLDMNLADALAVHDQNKKPLIENKEELKKNAKMLKSLGYMIDLQN